MLRCPISGTNSYDCPIPGPPGKKCFKDLGCVATPTPPPPPPSRPPWSPYNQDFFCKKLKKLQKDKKKEEKWAQKCGPPSL